MNARLGNLIASAVVSVGLLSPAASAGDGPVVVELFTSQGCSSCPPADALMRDLSSRDDVIALSLHVDYWDYIGWKDMFANPAHTQRQKAYAKAAGKRMIYTPQMIVGGEDHVLGSKSAELTTMIGAHLERDLSVQVEIERQDAGTVVIHLRAMAPLEGDVIVQLVRYRPSETVEIERGENAGNTYTYHNIVEDWQVLGPWTGEDTSLSAVAEGDHPVVAIVQQAGYGPILGAARLR